MSDVFNEPEDLDDIDLAETVDLELLSPAVRAFAEDVLQQDAEVRARNASLQVIAGHAIKPEVAAFQRKRKSIERLIQNSIRPIELKILELSMELQGYQDELQERRREMVEYCIHPADMLSHRQDGTVLCKFCNRTLAVVNKG